MNQNQQATILPIDRKMLLSIREAAEYSNIGINKIDEMLKQPNCPFVLYVGTKKLVKRKAFEEFIDNKATMERTLLIQVSDRQTYDTIERKYINILMKAIYKYFGQGTILKYRIMNA